MLRSAVHARIDSNMAVSKYFCKDDSAQFSPQWGQRWKPQVILEYLIVVAAAKDNPVSYYFPII